MTTVQEAGRRGGKKTAKRGSDYYREIQKKSAASRARNRAIHSKGLQADSEEV